jgi:hypothetical protein
VQDPSWWAHICPVVATGLRFVTSVFLPQLEHRSILDILVFIAANFAIEAALPPTPMAVGKLFWSVRLGGVLYLEPVSVVMLARSQRTGFRQPSRADLVS